MQNWLVVSCSTGVLQWGQVTSLTILTFAWPNRWGISWLSIGMPTLMVIVARSALFMMIFNMSNGHLTAMVLERGPTRRNSVSSHASSRKNMSKKLVMSTVCRVLDRMAKSPTSCLISSKLCRISWFAPHTTQKGVYEDGVAVQVPEKRLDV